MTRSEIFTANERVKAISNFLFNLAAALAGATTARVWVVERFDAATFIWLLVAVALFASAYGVLYWLEPEV